MTDQELIKRAIESAMARIYRVRDNAKGRTASHQRKAENQVELQKVTINALEKQIAKKVIKPKDGLESYYHEESCPNCKEEFRVKVVGYRFTSAIGEVNYCPYCGQKLDWGNEDAE